MPFVTEEIYQKYNEGSIVIASWPEVKDEYTFANAKRIETIFDIITAVRNIRAEKNVAPSKKIDLALQVLNEETLETINSSIAYLEKGGVQ